MRLGWERFSDSKRSFTWCLSLPKSSILFLIIAERTTWVVDVFTYDTARKIVSNVIPRNKVLAVICRCVTRRKMAMNIRGQKEAYPGWSVHAISRPKYPFIKTRLNIRVNALWISIRVFLSESIFWHEYFHGFCMDLRTTLSSRMRSKFIGVHFDPYGNLPCKKWSAKSRNRAPCFLAVMYEVWQDKMSI